MFEGNALLALIERLRTPFVGRSEIINTAGALVDPKTTGKGLQDQLKAFSIYTGSGALTLTTSYQDVPGVTTGAFTPAIAETALVMVIGYANLGAGTAQCTLGDRIRFALNVDTVNESGTIQLRALVSSATQTNQCGMRIWPISLTAGVAHTIKVQSTNVDGNRGQAETTTQMLVWRIAA